MSTLDQILWQKYSNATEKNQQYEALIEHLRHDNVVLKNKVDSLKGLNSVINASYDDLKKKLTQHEKHYNSQKSKTSSSVSTSKVVTPAAKK